MPELAEVEYYRKQWLPAQGQAVLKVHLHADKRIFREVDTTALKRGLKGQRLERAETHGKQMLFVFGPQEQSKARGQPSADISVRQQRSAKDKPCASRQDKSVLSPQRQQDAASSIEGPQHWLGVHLGMTGKTSTQDSKYRPAKHDHLVLEMENDLQLVFTDPRLFGRIHYAKNKAPPEWWSNLPPAILSDTFSGELMDRFLQRRSKAPIKAVLLMQEAFPGIGNWMADEIVWRARIRPATRCGKLKPKQRAELYRRVREVCRDALEVIGTDWSTPPDDWLFNHRWKDGGTCPKTGGPLVREKIGGRTTCWSPKWQG